MHHGLVLTGTGSTGAHDRLTAGRPSTALDRLLVDRLQRSVAAAPLRFELWDGYGAGREPEEAVGTIVFGRRRALVSWLWDPELYLGETYTDGSVHIRGDLEAVLEVIYRAWPDAVARRRWSLHRAHLDHERVPAFDRDHYGHLRSGPASSENGPGGRIHAVGWGERGLHAAKRSGPR